jgi:hypothetical protein
MTPARPDCAARSDSTTILSFTCASMVQASCYLIPSNEG